MFMHVRNQNCWIYVLEWHSIKYESNRWYFYCTFFKEKVNALKFNFANTLALAFELKFVCAIFSRFTGSTVDRSEFHNSCFYINGKDLINHLMSEFV